MEKSKIALIAAVIVCGIAVVTLAAVGGFDFIGIPPMIELEDTPRPVKVISPDGFNITIGNATMTLRNVNGTIIIGGASFAP